VDGEGVIHTVDVSNSALPQQAGVYSQTGGYVQGLDAAGTLLSFADGSGHLQVLDIADTASPVLTGTYVDENNGWLGAVIVSGSRVYTTPSSSAVQIVDITDPTAPQKIGEYTAELVWPPSIAVSGDRLFAAVRPGFDGMNTIGQNALNIVDVTDPGQIQVVGAYPGFVEAMTLLGPLALALIDDSVHLVDLSDQTLPKKLADIDGIAETRISALAATGEHLFVHYGFGAESGLAVVDISRFVRMFASGDPGDVDRSRTIANVPSH